MKQLYIVAQNPVSITVTDDIQPWKEIEPHFSPFAVSTVGKLALDISISTLPLPEYTGEIIYEPARAADDIITGRTSRLTDGSLVMEFMHVTEYRPRLLLKMPAGLNRADIVIAPGRDVNDSYFLSHALMIAYLLATAGNGTLLVHASTVLYRGKAYLFQGKSGTGKSTHASLWTANIPGAELLNDDHPVIRFTADGGTATVYGSPWSGKTHCYRNIAAPIGAFVRIARAQHNTLHHLTPLRAYASLTASVFYLPFIGEQLRDMRHMTIERLVTAVPCCEMQCRPDADAAWTCMKGLTTHP